MVIIHWKANYMLTWDLCPCSYSWEAPRMRWMQMIAADIIVCVSLFIGNTVIAMKQCCKSFTLCNIVFFSLFFFLWIKIFLISSKARKYSNCKAVWYHIVSDIIIIICWLSGHESFIYIDVCVGCLLWSDFAC